MDALLICHKQTSFRFQCPAPCGENTISPLSTSYHKHGCGQACPDSHHRCHCWNINAYPNIRGTIWGISKANKCINLENVPTAVTNGQHFRNILHNMGHRLHPLLDPSVLYANVKPSLCLLTPTINRPLCLLSRR